MPIFDRFNGFVPALHKVEPRLPSTFSFSQNVIPEGTFQVHLWHHSDELINICIKKWLCQNILENLQLAGIA